MDLDAHFQTDSDWGTGYVGKIIITNTSSNKIDSWNCSFSLPQGQTLTSLWCAKFAVNEINVNTKNEDWNGTINAGQSVSMGFCVNNPNAAPAQLFNLTANGSYNSPPPDDPAPPPGGFTLDAKYNIDCDWGTGYQLNITISNNTSNKTESWICEFDTLQGQNISCLWGGVHSSVNNHIKVTNPSWYGGGIVNPGSSVTIGMIINKSSQTTSGILNLIAYANGGTTPPPEPPQEPPSAPLLNPVDNPDQDGNYTVSWQGNANADTYSLEQDVSETFSNPVLIYTGSGLEKQVTDQSNGTYYYRVYASNSSGNSNYSNTESVTVNIPPPPLPPDPPVLYPIENSDNDGNFSILWSLVDNADTFLLEESVLQDFSVYDIIYQGTNNSYNAAGKPNGTFYYRVKAKNINGYSGPSNTEKAVIDSPPVPPSEYKIIGYYTNWSIYRNPSFKPESIAASKITHVNYAFAKIDTSGNVILIDPWADTDYRNDWNTQKPYWGNFRQLYDIKQEYPHLKIIISIGGWSLSNEFSPMTADPAARTNFVQKCIEFCETYDCFDGIDIDWEYPCYEEHNGHPKDKENFTKLLQELYTAFKQHDPPLLLTIAAPAGYWHYQNIELNKIHQYLDWINLMTYDFHGPWGGSEDSITNHLSPLYPAQYGSEKSNINSAVSSYIAKGVPAKKIVIGIPLYGRSYAGAFQTGDGLYSPYSSAGSGTTSEKGLRFFSDIKNNLLGEYTQYWDSACMVPYLHNENPASQLYGEFISYDDELSIRTKCVYAKQNLLGGVLIWELGTDTWTSGWDAVSAMEDELKNN